MAGFPWQARREAAKPGGGYRTCRAPNVFGGKPPTRSRPKGQDYSHRRSNSPNPPVDGNTHRG